MQLQQVNPPAAVAEAFRDVASAREDKNTYINEALAYQNEVVPVARGDAVVTSGNALSVTVNDNVDKDNIGVGIYAESTRGDAHLQRILQEAQAVVDAAIAAAPA